MTERNFNIMDEKREATITIRVPLSLKIAWDTSLSRTERSLKNNKMVLWMYEQIVEKQILDQHLEDAE